MTPASHGQDYEPVIGLEIHVQLSDAHEDVLRLRAVLRRAPNTLTCRSASPAGNAAAAQRARDPLRAHDGWRSVRSRAGRSFPIARNYFYPDLPKGYQISQYDEPLCRGGRLATCASIACTSRRTPRSSSTRARAAHPRWTLGLDFNRGGTPLAEIVTEPDVRSAAQRASG